jgi:hypothetical protein
VASQHDHDQESNHLATQLRVSEDMIMAATRRSDDMHALMADYGWRASVARGSSDEGFSEISLIRMIKIFTANLIHWGFLDAF